MVKYTHLYEDVNIKHLLRILRKISFIRDSVPYSQQKELAYQLQPRTLTSGEIIVKTGQPITSLVLVVQGHLEVIAEIDGVDFVIETLHEGSVLNHHSFFMEDVSVVYVRSGVPSKILELNQGILETFMNEHTTFQKILLLVQD